MNAADNPTLIDAASLLRELDEVRVLDCRFALGDSGQGELEYSREHIPGASYLHLERDLSSPVGEHGGRHPLPEPQDFCDRLATLGIARETPVVAYCASRFAFSSRLWWMMRSLGFTNVRLLDGGFPAWLAQNGPLETAVPGVSPVSPYSAPQWSGLLDIDGLRRAQADGALLVDSREERRYLGLEEPIDPVAGHIPGAVNFPWQGVSTEDGLALPDTAQGGRWADIPGDPPLVVYCGSGVTACVNLLSLHLAGRKGARLYGGSWSDWCSWL